VCVGQIIHCSWLNPLIVTDTVSIIPCCKSVFVETLVRITMHSTIDDEEKEIQGLTISFGHRLG